jgi:ribosome-binding factor A
LKFTPTLVFVPDVVPETARQLEDLLAAAKDGDAKVAEQAAGAVYAGDPDPYKHPDDDDADDTDDERA